MKLQGGETVKRLFDELPRKVQKSGLRKAVTAGSTPILKQARRNAPKESGLLKKAISRKVKTYKSGNAAAIIGAKKNVEGTYGKKKRIPAKYLHIVERGAKGHAIARNASSGGTGRIWQHPGTKAQPFLENAYRDNKSQAAELAGNKLAETVIAEARKLGNNNA